MIKTGLGSPYDGQGSFLSHTSDATGEELLVVADGGSRLFELKGRVAAPTNYQDSEFDPRPRLINLVMIVCCE